MVPPRFQRTAAEQSESRLVSLPEELTVGILNYLLTAPEGPRSGRYHAITLTCQKMHGIGNAVLYKDNVPRLFFSYPNGGRLSHMARFSNPNPNGFSSRIFKTWDISNAPKSPAWSFMSRFDSLIIELGSPLAPNWGQLLEEAALFDMIRLGYKALTGKRLTIILHRYPAEWQADTSDSAAVAIRAFQSLRCKSIEFHGTAGKEAQVIAQTVRVVESDAPVTHFYAIFKPLFDEGTRYVRLRRGIPVNESLKLFTYLQRTWNAVRARDENEFDRCRRLVLRYLGYHRDREGTLRKLRESGGLKEAADNFKRRARDPSRRRRNESEILQDESGEWLCRRTGDSR